MPLDECEFRLSEQEEWKSFASDLSGDSLFSLVKDLQMEPAETSFPIISLRKIGIPEADPMYWEGQISPKRLLYLITADNEQIPDTKRFDLTVVYFANLGLSAKWELILRPQIIELLKAIRLLEAPSKIRVIICLNSPIQDISTVSSMICALLIDLECSHLAHSKSITP